MLLVLFTRLQSPLALDAGPTYMQLLWEDIYDVLCGVTLVSRLSPWPNRKPTMVQPIVVEMTSIKFLPTCVAMFSGRKRACKIELGRLGNEGMYQYRLSRLQ